MGRKCWLISIVAIVILLAACGAEEKPSDDALSAPKNPYETTWSTVSSEEHTSPTVETDPVIDLSNEGPVDEEIHLTADDRITMVREASTYQWSSRFYITEDGSLYSGAKDPILIMRGVCEVVSFDGINAVITNSGALYCWRKNEVPYKLITDVKQAYVKGGLIYALIDNGDLFVWTDFDGKYTGYPELVMCNCAQIIHSEKQDYGYGAAITASGELLMWRIVNDKYIVEPTKMMDDCASAVLCQDTFAAITINGDLYMWGDNIFSECGADSEMYPKIEAPMKVLSNVVSVKQSLGGFTAALTGNGDLYIWGSNVAVGVGRPGTSTVGQLGLGSEEREIVPPTLLMSDVSTMEIFGSQCAAVKNNGDLYYWCASVPELMLQDVTRVQFTEGRYSAITSDGGLYLWGDNSHGEVGNGTDETCKEPYLALQDVSEYFLCSSYTVAITNDDSFYNWGAAVLGTGTYEYYPVKFY